MARYKAILTYDGTNFYGFQRQAKSSKNRTVQSVLELALGNLGWQGRSILSAGRTDTGVHAFGQVVAFDLEWDHSPDELRSALNAKLPMDVAVREVYLASLDFHPRYDAVARRYRYQIFCQPIRDPMRERFAWRVWPEVELERMQKAAEHLVGSHDFSSFGSPPRIGGKTIRNVYHAVWNKDQGNLVFEIVANAFLFHMVRRLVSIPVLVGQGVLEPEEVLNYLDTKSPSYVKGLAPPQGLTLMEVIYSA